MNEYMVKFELIGTATKEVVKLTTKRYKTSQEARDEYVNEATKRTTMGIMEMVVAELYEFIEESDKVKRITTLVDWRRDKKTEPEHNFEEEILLQTLKDRNKTVNMLLASMKEKFNELEQIWSKEDLRLISVHHDDTIDILDEMQEDIGFLIRQLC